MKKINLLLVIVTLIITIPVYSQTQKKEYNIYKWEENPKLTNTDLDTSNNSVVIFNKIFYEYVYENNALFEYKTIHKRVKLITHSGIDNNNKIYIPLYDKDEIVNEKARVIKNDGSVKELKKEEIKEAFDQESETKYHYFAFEGIDIGCEIEYLYCVKHIPTLSGTMIKIQSGIPVLHFEAKYATPVNLIFKFKSYNGCPNVILDTNEKGRNVWIIKKDSIPRLKDEEGAAYKDDLMKYIVKLDRNTFTGKKDVYAYGPIASDLYDKIYNTLDSKDTKAINNFIKDLKSDALNEEGKIRAVENYIKTNYIYDKTNDPSKSVISTIVSNKSFNDLGGTRLFANIFKKLNIEVEIVLTSDRFENKFDKDFESYSYLNKYLIFFPKINKFLSPFDNFTRLGFPDNSYINNYGLFIKTISMGDYNTGLGKIKFIQGAKYNESRDILKVTADFTQSFTDTKYEITREMSGYIAANYQPFFDFIIDQDKLKDFSESIIKYIDKEGSIDNLTFENKGGNFLGQKPLITKANLKSGAFIEKAGPKFLFKVGMLIGPQLELYEKDKRKLPLEFPYSHIYYRTIDFIIPDGYNVSNLNQLKINETYIRNTNDSTMSFISDYKLENNRVTISIVEFYKEYDYTLSEFEEYRRVANAAANFNKVVLVFEKK